MFHIIYIYVCLIQKKSEEIDFHNSFLFTRSISTTTVHETYMNRNIATACFAHEQAQVSEKKAEKNRDVEKAK